MASNIIQLSFNGETSVVSEELVYKYDYGQQIEFTDLTLPEYFEVHFSNNKTGKATKQIGHNGVVDIPDRYLEIGSVYGWIFLHNTDSDGETEYEFKIPVKNRAMPSDGEVTPEQESAISQAIAALTSTQASVQALHDETEGYRDDASASSTSASASQDAAETAQGLAETAQGLAETAQGLAEDAQTAAETAQGKAEDAQAAAEAARDEILDMGIVQDVVIGGTSIVSDNVANIPTADTYYAKYGLVKLSDVVESGDNYNTVQLKYTRQGSAKSKTLATSAVATTSKRGLMSKDDKTKLDGIASGAEANVQSDWDQTDTSADDYIKNKPTLADVAMSGSYSDLEDTPTFADVAMSGSYNDLADTPSIPTKVSDLENDVPYAEEASLKSALPTDTASGDIASFPDGTDLFPALSVKAQIEPIQIGSGTPSPDNVRPISGHTECVTERTGKNLFDGTLLNGYYDADNNGAFVSSANWRATNKMRCKPSTTYVMSGTSYSGGSYNGRSFFWDMNGNYLGARGTGANFTSYPNSAYMALYFGASYVTDAIQIEEGSTATDYEPYNGDTYTTELGRTVYGGTLDVVSGVLVVDRAMVDLGTLNWDYDSTSFPSWPFFQSDSLHGIRKIGWNNFICSAYRLSTAQYSRSEDMVINGAPYHGYGDINIRDSSYTDSATFKSAMSGVQLCYELATPQTYQLDPQTIDLLLGQNNLWTDCGSVEVTYKADTQKYIDKKFAELQALVLEQ